MIHNPVHNVFSIGCVVCQVVEIGNTSSWNATKKDEPLQSKFLGPRLERFTGGNW